MAEKNVTDEEFVNCSLNKIKYNGSQSLMFSKTTVLLFLFVVIPFIILGVVIKTVDVFPYTWIALVLTCSVEMISMVLIKKRSLNKRLKLIPFMFTITTVLLVIYYLYPDGRDGLNHSRVVVTILAVLLPGFAILNLIAICKTRRV